MKSNDPNIQQVQLVAKALGPLREQLVLVGGCAVGLLITDLAAPPARATQDVDMVAEVASKLEYYKLQEQLRKLGFKEDTGNVICRWRLGELKVDVMPTSEGVLNFKNKWYQGAVEEAIQVTLPDETKILLVTAPYFVATKLEAFSDRGNGDYLQSHDIEDIVNVFDGRPSVVAEILSQRGPVGEFLKVEMNELMSDPLFLEAVPGHFRPNKVAQERATTVFERLRTVAGI